MDAAAADRGIEALVRDLSLLRRQGLMRLRRLDLPAMARLAGRSDGAAAPPAGIERLLRAAVDALGGGQLGDAALLTFGLAPGTRDWPAQDRRRRAAELYGVSVERFRKSQEVVILEQVAVLVEQVAADRASQAPVTAPEQWGADAPAETAPGLRFGARVELVDRNSRAAAPVVVHLRPMELLTDIDILVCPSNVFLEVAKIYSHTVSGRIREAAALRDAAGRIADDVVQREIQAWHRAHGGLGAPLPPGTTVSTSPGALAERGIARLYHVAAVAPGPSGDQYFVTPDQVARSVREVFALARRDRELLEPPPSSLCFPLIGAGRGGMKPEDSAQALVWSVREELARDPGWRVHFAVRRAERAAVLLDVLRASGFQEA